MTHETKLNSTVMTNKEQKLKADLNDAIQKWIDDAAGRDVWDAFAPSVVSDMIGELMTDAAFAVLMAQKDVNEYMEREQMLKD